MLGRHQRLFFYLSLHYLGNTVCSCAMMHKDGVVDSGWKICVPKTRDKHIMIELVPANRRMKLFVKRKENVTVKRCVTYFGLALKSCLCWFEQSHLECQPLCTYVFTCAYWKKLGMYAQHRPHLSASDQIMLRLEFPQVACVCILWARK